MPEPQRDLRIPLPAARHRWLLPAFLSAGITAWCVFYLSRYYPQLAGWMRSLGAELPHELSWQQDYFTPAAWRQGRWLAITGIPGFLLLLICCLRQWQRGERGLSSLRISRQDALYSSLLMLIAAGCWLYGQSLSEPGPDEMYSARYCGASHPLRTVAYYMDPNNHVLFNLLNRLLFFFAPDKLLTGRVLSGIAYVLLLPLLYRLARRYTESAAAAALIALVLGLQFGVMGFAALARGYLLYLLLQWLAAAAFCRYWEAEEKQGKHLLTYALATAGGFWVMPTFLYLFATLSLAALILQLRARRWDGRFWRYTALALACTAAAYWPVLLFSGAGAVTGNKFVSAQPDFVQVLDRNLGSLLQEELWLSYPERSWWPLLLFALPLAGWRLLRRKGAGLPLLLFALAWPVYLALATLLQRFAFPRNLIFQESLSLALLLLLLYQGSRWLAGRPFAARKIGRRAVSGALFALPLLALGIHFLTFFRKHADDALYGLSTRWHNGEISDRIRRLPPGTTIAAPDFAVAWQYLGERAGYPVSVRAAGRPGPEAVLVTHYTDEPGPIQIPGYARIREFLFYRIYLKRPVDSGLLRVVEGF